MIMDQNRFRFDKRKRKKNQKAKYVVGGERMLTNN